jgi:hypothetical protein
MPDDSRLLPLGSRYQDQARSVVPPVTRFLIDVAGNPPAGPPKVIQTMARPIAVQ